jgi:hypothetical protein
MKIRSLSIASMSAVAVLFGLGHVSGCGGTTDESSADEALAALVACHLDDGTVEHNALLRACDPQHDAKKTTICHIPPGNPANAHTLCIGNPAVPHHLSNHGDYLGPCHTETRCPPPPPTGDASGTGGHSVSSGGAIGTGTGTGGAGGAGVEISII